MLDKLFDKFTTYEITGFGHEIYCKKELWGVCAPTKEQAEIEARNYFRQYYSDGEYDLDTVEGE